MYYINLYAAVAKIKLILLQVCYFKFIILVVDRQTAIKILFLNFYYAKNISVCNNYYLL